MRATDAATNLSGYSNTASATTTTDGSSPTFRQTNNAVPQSPVSTVSVTFTAAQSAGNLNVVAIGWSDTTSQVLSVTDNRSNNYQRAAGPTTQAQTGTQSIYYAPNIVAAPAGGTTITVTFNAAVNNADVRIAEYSGIDLLNPVDVTVSGTGTGTTSNSGTVTTTNPSDLLVGANYVTNRSTGPGSSVHPACDHPPQRLDPRRSHRHHCRQLQRHCCPQQGQLDHANGRVQGSNLWRPPDTTAPSTPS